MPEGEEQLGGEDERRYEDLKEVVHKRRPPSIKRMASELKNISRVRRSADPATKETALR